MIFSWKNMQKYVVTIFLVSILVLYLLSADSLFDTIIPVQGESRSVSFPIPNESKTITYSIDLQNTKNIEWKTAIYITGWAFIQGENSNITKKYIVLVSENSTYIFETLQITRPDVNKVFRSHHTDYRDSGFYSNIPIYDIRNGKYLIGIILKNETMASFTLTDKRFTKIDSLVISGFLSEKRSPLYATHDSDFNYSFDERLETEIGDLKVLSIAGWAFIPGDNGLKTKKYVVLSSKNATYLFDTFSVSRPDVANSFNDQTPNVINSGFQANIPLDTIKNETYKLGIIIQNNGEVFQNISDIQIPIPMEYHNEFEKNITIIDNLETLGLISKSRETLSAKNSTNIKYSFDERLETEIGDIKVLSVAGWAFIPGDNESETKKYVVLSSKNATYLFDTFSVSRPDVANFFNDQTPNVINSGFQANIPLDSIKNETYKLGIIIQNNGELFQNISDSQILIPMEYQNEFEKDITIIDNLETPGLISRSRETLSAKNSTNIKYSFDEKIETEISDIKVLSVAGWAFIPGDNESETKKYVVLSSKNATYTFDTFPVPRPDVANFFNDQTPNVINSGFQANIPLDSIKNETYKLGIIIQNNGAVYQNISDIQIPIPMEYHNEFEKDITIIDNLETSGLISKSRETLSAKNSTNIKYSFDEKLETEIGDIKVLSVAGWAFIPGDNESKTKRFIVLSSKNATYTFDTFPVPRPDVANFFNDQTPNVINSGFQANIPLDSIKNETYKIGIIIQNDVYAFQNIKNDTITVPMT